MSNYRVSGKQLPKKKKNNNKDSQHSSSRERNRNILKHVQHPSDVIDPKNSNLLNNKLLISFLHTHSRFRPQVPRFVFTLSRTHVTLVHAGRMDKCNKYNTTTCAKDNEIAPYQSAFFFFFFSSCQRRRLELVSFLGISRDT